MSAAKTIVRISWADEELGTGGVDEIVLDGSDQPTRAAARELIRLRISDPDDLAYRGCIYDPLSQRNSFDSDNTWYDPTNPQEVAA